MKLYCPYCDEGIEIKTKINFYMCPHCKNKLEKTTRICISTNKKYEILRFSDKQDKICPDCQKGTLTTKENYPFNAGVIYYCNSCKAIFHKLWPSKKDFMITKL